MIAIHAHFYARSSLSQIQMIARAQQSKGLSMRMGFIG